MFTGLIESIGRVSGLLRKSEGFELLIEDDLLLSNAKEGDSVSVDGVCLTIKRKRNREVLFDVSEETVRRTIINDYKRGRMVNLESALKVDGRMGGHFVSGHIDTSGVVKERADRSEFIELKISFDSIYSPLVVEKGSIAINGVSLTINETKGDSVKMILIPHTIEHTNLKFLRVGDRVNIEFDMIGKYVIKYLMKSNTQDLRLKRLLEEGEI